VQQLKHILASVPDTITLVVGGPDVIIEAFGLEHVPEQTRLANLLGKVNADRMRSLAVGETIMMSWSGHDYEVHYQPLDGEKNGVYYLLDHSRCSSVTSKLHESLHDLESKKEELQAVFDLAANGISILNRRGTFLYANRFFQEMMGYTMQELTHESCISLSSKEYATASKSAVERAIREGSVINFRKVCVTKSGEHLNASMSLSYLKNRDEILMITADITEDVLYQNKLERQVEAEVAKRTEQYEVMCHQSRLAAMGEMIDSIAHQWRQPLNGLGMIVQGLRHLHDGPGLDKTMLREIECEIMEKVRYMSQTIEDFSSFFRLSKETRPFNVAEGAREALRLIEAQLKHEGIEACIHVAEGTDPDIDGLPNEFRQVIVNLVHNAMTAIVRNQIQDGRIVIDINRIDDEIHVSVTDNGGGIAAEILQQIFDPYFTTRENGSGIGLYMSKVIVEHHMKGRLHAENRSDGAQFRIELPTQEDGNAAGAL